MLSVGGGVFGVALVVGYWFGFVALWFACCLFYCFGVGGGLFLWVCGVSAVGFRVLYLVGCGVGFGCWCFGCWCLLVWIYCCCLFDAVLFIALVVLLC